MVEEMLLSPYLSILWDGLEFTDLDFYISFAVTV